jgi:glycosyltransferase involved in cell wall biosynthesis
MTSVVIPAYNAAATIERAIRSVLIQDEPIEIVVVDDGSTDETAGMVRSFTDERIVVLRSEANRGAAAARNLGIAWSRGKYVAFLDADDAWRPDKLAIQVKMMERDPGLVLCTCDSVFVGPSGEIRRRSHAYRPPVSGPDAWRALLTYSFIATPTVLARRDDLVALGGFNEALPVAEDLDLWIRLALRGSVGVVREVLVEIHDQPDSLLKRHRHDESEYVMRLLDGHLAALQHRLAGSEVRRIRGQRLFECAAIAYWHRQHRRSAALFWQAALCGTRPLKSMLNVPRAILMSCLRGGA